MVDPKDARAEEAIKTRHWAVRAVVSWAVIATIGCVALFVQHDQTVTALNRSTAALAQTHMNYQKILSTERTQQMLIQNSCIRLNVLRAIDNKSHYADFLVFRYVAAFSKVPRNATPEQRAVGEGFLRQLHSAVRAKSWVPLTDCVAADASGLYRSPTPVPFSKKLPPSSALSDTNADKLDPVGSVR